MLSFIKAIVPRSIKFFILTLSIKQTIYDLKLHNLFQLLAPCLPKSICIDVGASHYPHIKWKLFLDAINVTWVAVEPNKNNLSYIDVWKYTAKVKTVTTGLSKDGGIKILYVTNVDTGSSLLEPVIPPGMMHRITEIGENYFFPLKVVEINTITLADIIHSESEEQPVMVKLDTQGTELSILQGAHDLLMKKRIVAIEMESTFLAQPVMQGSGKFWEACEYLEKMGFELLDIKPITETSGLNQNKVNSKRYLNECDAVFSLRRDISDKLPLNYRVVLFSFYLTNNYFEEALSIMKNDSDIEAFFKNKNVNLDDINKTLNYLALH